METQVFPVSVKGVAVQGGKVLLLLNERDEWELPGGKLEVGEDSSDCVVREIGEESGWQVTAGPLLDCWQYEVRAGVYVVIVTYGCHVLSTGPPVVSHEHKQAGLFAPEAVLGLVMPDGYKRSIADWFARLGGGQVGLGQRPPGADGMAAMAAGGSTSAHRDARASHVATRRANNGVDSGFGVTFVRHSPPGPPRSPNPPGKSYDPCTHMKDS